SLTAVDTNSAAELGLSVQTGTAGQNVAGTIGGREATGEGQLLTVKGGGADGMQVRITGGMAGNRGSINFIERIGERTVNLVTDILGAEGALTGRSDRYQKELEKIAEERLKLNLRIESLSSRLSKQFAIADRMISQLQSTGNYITAQLDALNASNKK